MLYNFSILFMLIIGSLMQSCNMHHFLTKLLLC